MFSKLYLYIAITIIVLGSAAYYISTTQKKIIELSQTTAELQIALDSSETTINSLTSNIDRVRTDYSELENKFQQIRSQNNELRQRFANSDLLLLSTEKPGLVQSIINDASDDALRCFELQSGAPLTEEELNAQNERDFNSECPWLWSSLVR